MHVVQKAKMMIVILSAALASVGAVGCGAPCIPTEDSGDEPVSIFITVLDDSSGGVLAVTPIFASGPAIVSFACDGVSDPCPRWVRSVYSPDRYGASGIDAEINMLEVSAPGYVPRTIQIVYSFYTVTNMPCHFQNGTVYDDFNGTVRLAPVASDGGNDAFDGGQPD